MSDATIEQLTAAVELCDYCGLEPFKGDEYPEPFSGWSCIVCAAQIGQFDE